MERGRYSLRDQCRNPPAYTALALNGLTTHSILERLVTHECLGANKILGAKGSNNNFLTSSVLFLTPNIAFHLHQFLSELKICVSHTDCSSSLGRSCLSLGRLHFSLGWMLFLASVLEILLHTIFICVNIHPRHHTTSTLAWRLV